MLFSLRRCRNPIFPLWEALLYKVHVKHRSHWANKRNYIIMLNKKYICNIRQIWLAFWQGISECHRTVARADSYLGLMCPCRTKRFASERSGEVLKINLRAKKRVTLKKMKIKNKIKTWTSWVVRGYKIRRIGIDFLVYFLAKRSQKAAGIEASFEQKS